MTPFWVRWRTGSGSPTINSCVRASSTKKRSKRISRPLAAAAAVATLSRYVLRQTLFIDWLGKKGFGCIDVGSAEAKGLGANRVALGNGKVLSMAGSKKLNEAMRARGYEVYDPDMSMFTLGGGGVHCLCQSLRRDPV